MENPVALLGHGADWHAERRQGIGGSEAKRVMDGDWYALWMEKTGRQEPEDLSDVLQVQLGSYTEPFIRAWHEKQTGVPVRTTDCDHLVHPVHGFMRANLDGRTPHGVIEIKHVSAFAKDEEIVSRYYPQCQHLMAVTSEAVCDLSVLFGNHKWQYFAIQRDEEYIADLIEREAEFWWHVENDTPPPSEVDAVKTEIAFDDLREVDMTGSNAWAEHASTWLDTKDAAKKFKKAETEIKALVESDVKQARGNGISVKRSKAGALSIKEDK